jgi:cytochrome c5
MTRALFLLVASVAMLLVGCAQPSVQRSAALSKQSDSTAAAAWEQVASVLLHPRCINCHTATEYPQQGDDRHRHLFGVVRGAEGKGVPGQACTTCHLTTNNNRTGAPGGPHWHLAPLSMAWQDANDQPLSSGAICRRLKDKAKNGNRSAADLVEHHEQEPLVLWAFSPGKHPGGTARSVPPLTHAQFVAASRVWAAAGAPCPAE